MTEHQPQNITADEADFVLRKMAQHNYVPNEAGEFVGQTKSEAMNIDHCLTRALREFDYSRPQRIVVAKIEQATRDSAETAVSQDVVSPLDAFRKFGITACEGEAFVVVGDTARDEVEAAFTGAVSDLFKADHPDATRWTLVQATSDATDTPPSVEPKQWRCTALRLSQGSVCEERSRLAERGLAFDMLQAAREPESAPKNANRPATVAEEIDANNAKVRALRAATRTRILGGKNFGVIGIDSRAAMVNEIATELARLPEGVWRFEAVLLADFDDASA